MPSHRCESVKLYYIDSFFVSYTGNGARVCSTFTGISQLKRATIICYRKVDLCYQEKHAEIEVILNSSTQKPELRSLSLVILLRFFEDFCP